ncbi:DUF1569 domain-containing protein [Chitinophaga barathri]|uniref:DinB family protein n=1 Tax=Chitinophaga barathri TaxID=1647451 RepID=A0A3N4MX29_9BACT|nr:DUF1569 domain-containing protein [Chitinophaga barathri]RPD39953.1 DinB family protein [Chitinophaga barathri]
MKTIFDKAVRDELTNRINSLGESSQAQWGKMNVYQMIKHCNTWNAWVQGKQHSDLRQEFLGKIFGKMALKSNTRDDTPMKKGMPAGKAFTIKEKAGDVAVQRDILKGLIADYAHFSNEGFIHDFFGKMTKEQIGVFAYKHVDHHLRQFGV